MQLYARDAEHALWKKGMNVEYAHAYTHTHEEESTAFDIKGDNEDIRSRRQP